MGRIAEFEPARAEAALPAERLEKLREELGRRYPKLLNFCRLLVSYETPDRNEAIKELAQETMLRALKGLSTYNGDGMKTWLSVIARNTAAEMFRKKHTKGYPDRNHLNAEPLDEDTNLADPRSLGYEYQLDDKRNEALFEEALRLLGSEYQPLWSLTSKGMGPREIASVMGMNENTVKTKLSRMTEKLRGIIKRLRLQQVRKRKNQ